MSDKLDFAGRQRASELLDWIVDCPEEAAHRLAALEAENAVLKSAVVGLLRLCEETRNERGLPYIYPNASEIVEAKQALALLTAEEQE